MTSRAVTVLAPNGRRQTVKCNLNTTILQILEDVCKKQGFNSSEYDIKHHNKVLDTSLTVQFSGLPNNAQLELAASTKSRKDSEIMVALNLEDGSRVLGTFLPSSTLQDILNTLYDSQKSNPVVIYMRREIYGEDLSRTDLRSLGLTGGRAMLRVVHKTPEELKTQANVSNTIPAKPVVEKPYKRVFQPVEVEESKKSPPKMEEAADDKILPQTKNYSARPDILKLAKEKIVEKVVTKECSPMDVDPQETENLESGQDSSLHNEEVDRSIVMEQAQSERMKEMKLEDFPFTGVRHGLIYHIESSNPRPMDDPPDDFFNLTINDAKTILRDVRKHAEEAEEGGPLLTAALRQLEESKKQLRHLSKYRKCIIRILFPDRVILQGVFAPKDSIKTVSEFVKEHLAVANIPFYLYTTPPKYILPEDKMLLEVDCVPVALLHFGLDEKYRNDQIKFIREDLKDKFTTNSMASLAAQMIRNGDRKKIAESSDENPIAGCSKDSDSMSNPVKRNTNSSGKVPKWFKGT
ncbi:tether containing UBX domain for GLUT4 [Coccinella septempunctata]|uniref:tether containing UBX domain for GLUT4 n=1 Tax=Coccinella septempunctata TaxID=41139 RepID=UPI001D075978|nr:tether containing UBX domain for GLUT4 [Coccinella septempunctata]